MSDCKPPVTVVRASWRGSDGSTLRGTSRVPSPALLPLVLATAALLSACAGKPRYPGDNQPTLATLDRRDTTVTPDAGLRTTEEQTIAAYRRFLQAAPEAPQRALALRRLGDLEMDRADRLSAEGRGELPDYRAAIAQYEGFLKAYPADPRNDRVLYQLARAQEQGGQLEAALKTLNRLVTAHAGTAYADEAQFRRGELLFTTRDYTGAEAAYAAVLGSGQLTPLRERALYMQGWSRFKQGRLQASLEPFFEVLDARLGDLDARSRDEADLSQLPGLQRADRELVEDSFRVLCIALAGLQGAESIAPLVNTPRREAWQYRAYAALGELYLKQDRIKDAADTYALFVRRQPLHAQAPVLQARVIEIYAANGLPTLALQAKRDHVVRYGADSEFRRRNPAGWRDAQPLVKTHLVELARHHHALSQRGGTAADAQEAERWYRTLLSSFPTDADAPGHRFLLAELLASQRRWADAVPEYEAVAYGSVPGTPDAADARVAHAGSQRGADAGNQRGADAGYAALLARAELETAAPDAATRAERQRQSVAAALRQAQAYPADARTGAVLTRAAEQLYALREGERAAAVARQALALQPPPAPELRRTAWTVIGHQAFEQAQYAAAEQAYAQVLALMPPQADGLPGLAERQAAAIYRQGEVSRTAGAAREAVGHFQRVAALPALAAGSPVRASAQFDAAAALIGLKDWDGAAGALEDFRRQHPGHPLQAEVAPKLALAYLEAGRSSQAAAEFERVATQAADPLLARGALWQAAELHDQAAAGAAPKSPLLAAATRTWERYLQQYPQPLEPAVEARWRLATLARREGHAAKATAWVQAVQQADAGAGDARTVRTRKLAGQAMLLLAEPTLDAYRKVPLVEPLARQLKLKKAKMEDVLRAYAAASELQVAEVTTAATFHTAALYQDFGKALLASQRPKKLSKAEAEQYNVMLEEQAFPFEEKAIELHEANARRAATGLYDRWVQDSYGALAALKPVRWGKSERADPALPAEVAALQSALQALGAANGPQAAPHERSRLLNQLGIAQRRLGRFTEARAAYEAAIAADPAAAAPVMNLAILHDLYLGEKTQALALYQRCLELSPGDAAVLGRWVAELKARKPEPGAATVARKESP